MTIANRHTMLLFMLLSSGCSVLNLNDNDENDTQLGDDDGEEEGETGAEDPNQVPDHGIAQKCVDRWDSNATVAQDLLTTVNADLVAIHERWWSPKTRSYVNAIDISDKPSPMVVPPMCGAADPLWGDAWDDPGQSCLVSGYHAQLPSVVTMPDPGAVQWPYSANIVTGTIGNPPESGRHTWMAEPCCLTPPTPQEISEWIMLSDEEALLIGNKSADCALHSLYKGVHSEAGGYYSSYDEFTRRLYTAQFSECVNNHVMYNPAQLAPIKASSLGSWNWFHTTTKQHTTPLNLNYEWVASWGLIEWEDFAAFGETIDAVVAALLSVLYLPPDGFEHPRYGGGSGCWYPVSLKYVTGWQARITCPYGYYDVLPDFNSSDLETRIDGVVGHCAIDGVGGGDFGDAIGPVVALSPAESGHSHMYIVHDLEQVVETLNDVRLGGNLVTAEMVDTFVNADGSPLLMEGDVLAWYSSPGVSGLSPGEALRRTLGYDIEELMTAMSWTRERAQEWADNAPPVELSKLLPSASLPESLAQRRGNDLRARNTWRMRVERSNGLVMFIYLRIK